MGFFSSRKAEDNDSYQFAIGVGASGAGTGTAGTKDDKSVVRVIRSRFYGSKRGKDREDSTLSYKSGAATAAASQTAHSSNPVASSPLASAKQHGRSAVPGPSILRSHNGDRSVPATPSKKSNTQEREPDSISVRTGASARVKHASSTGSFSPRRNTDTVTLTLAQRLNELAVANSEGLLNDDEYRLLRQNLFERFATNVSVPTEASVVPVAAARPRPPKDGASSDRPTSRPVSNFHVDRPLSIMSKSSATSGFASLFRRTTERRSSSKDMSDTSSVWSAKSNTSFFRMPRLSKKSSDSSVRTSASRTLAGDTASISSRRHGSEKGEHSLYVSTPRSAAGSIRQMKQPPSAFNPRAVAQDRNTSMYVFEDEKLITVQEIQQEILSVEAESKRLMDAFNGLEVTTLARSQRHRVRPSPKSTEFRLNNPPESVWGDSDGRSQRRINLADDAISMRSGVSIGTAPSVSHSLARSTYSAKKSPRIKGSLPSPMAVNHPPLPLHKKHSSSSVTSERKLRPLPPVPALPNSISQGHLKAASSSNVSLIRSATHLPMNTVPEDSDEKSINGTIHTVHVDESEDLETELDDIKRRREEVAHRYEGRLEYLRAKLKGAQLHEKLMRK